MSANVNELSSPAERLVELRRSYEEKALRLANVPASDSALSDLLAEWPTLYPPWTRRLDEYDSAAFGPLLAVSDEGSAGAAIARAARSSAKARALPGADAMSLGIMLDGERMTSGGEAPIGPDEYDALLSSAFGQILCSTNVGVRVNARVYRLFPEFPLPDGAVDNTWLKSLTDVFLPFLNTPDGKPRPLEVRVSIRPGISGEILKDLFQRLEEARTRAGLAPAPMHRFAPFLNFDREIRSKGDVDEIGRVIAAAAAAGFRELVLDGEPLIGARQRVMLPSLLNILELSSLKTLFDVARPLGVKLSYRYQIDADTAARTVWTGLQAARSYGITAGKYGLVPLTLGEQKRVVELICRWTTGWTAIPAFYADTALVTDDDVYDEPRRIEGAFLWMKTVAAAGTRLVLIDCPDRVSPRHLFRESDGDKGVWTISQIVEVDRHARELGLRALWSGGITARQAFAIASCQVLGIFSTSATARHVAVQGGLVPDPQLAVEGEPTEEGVRRVHTAIQCGFLSTALAAQNRTLADRAGECGLKLLAAIDAGAGIPDALVTADTALVDAWKEHWKGRGTLAGVKAAAPPANAVRVWRGRRRKGLDQKTFFQKLGGIFIPFTVEMQRLYGLAAYLPAVMPASKPDEVPDEIALVFYKTQQAYLDSRNYPAGRAYGDLHALVFDLENSGTGFPKLLEADFELNQPWHLFDQPVDWQKGTTWVFAGLRKKDVPVADYKAAVAVAGRSVQSSDGAIDGAVLFASEDWLLYWQHSATADTPLQSFAGFAEAAYKQAARPTWLQTDLTVPYDGLTVAGGEFFNLQFPLA